MIDFFENMEKESSFLTKDLNKIRLKNTTWLLKGFAQKVKYCA
jgi:hypothetical protein